MPVSNTMKIVDNIHHLECPFNTPTKGLWRPGYFTGATVILGEGITLIDCGVESSPEEVIFPYIKTLGRNPSEITHVILTHGHGDHFGGIGAIRKVAKVKLCVHEGDSKTMEDPLLGNRQSHARFPSLYPLRNSSSPGLKADIVFKDGDSFDLSGHKLEIVKAPGHSAGSVCIADRQAGVFISGDSIQGRGAIRPLLAYSAIEYVNSMNRLIGKDIKTLLLGHLMPPFYQSVLKGENVKMLLRESLLAVQELEDKVLGVLASQELSLDKRPMNVIDVHSRLPGTIASSVGCILEKLAAEGRVTKEEDFIWKVR